MEDRLGRVRLELGPGSFLFSGWRKDNCSDPPAHHLSKGETLIYHRRPTQLEYATNMERGCLKPKRSSRLGLEGGNDDEWKVISNASQGSRKDFLPPTKKISLRISMIYGLLLVGGPSSLTDNFSKTVWPCIKGCGKALTL